MAETHQIITKVWIAPGCIVCDACENDCPEVFDVTEETCLIRPPAQNPDFLRPLTPSIIVAAEGCPVEVIKFETKEVEGPAPWANEPEASPAAAGAEVVAKAPAAKVAAPPAPPDPRFQALLTTSKISPSLSASLATTVRRSAEVNQGEEMVRAIDKQGVDWRHAPPDQRMAVLAAGGAYAPQPSMGERLRASAKGKVSRRTMNLALVVAWGSIAAVTATFGAMFQDFFGPKVLKEPKKVWRIGRLDQFSQPGAVDESYKKTPAGSEGFWVVNLQPTESKLVAISTICTHLGCIPNWLSGDQKYKCPCHGSGYYKDGINFEGPTPRPLERFAINQDADGFVWVDQRKIYRHELGEWDNPESFLTIV
ncbi:MAG TPA: Rieske 2Fe-2S domain-containing protein [Tepidisphaeraceae bacterium]|nr:Rieske 2Fe-2S domain-containing protein [Tepidisphaeraceae bacterium]